MQGLNQPKHRYALSTGPWNRGLFVRLAASLQVLALLSLALPEQANARTFSFLGVRTAGDPVARFLTRDAESAFTYESLSLLEISLSTSGTTRWTPLVSAAQANKHQRAGVSDLHRMRLEQKEVEAQDNSELLGFQPAEEVACYSVQVEAKTPPVHLEVKAKDHGFAWTCVLASGDSPTARILLEVQGRATMIHFAPDNQRPVIRVAKIPHLQVELPHRGPRALPVVALSKAYRVPHPDQQRFIYLLVFRRSRPLVAKLAPQDILVLLHPDSLQKPDGGLVTSAGTLLQSWASR